MGKLGEKDMSMVIKHILSKTRLDVLNFLLQTVGDLA